jgi:hypothetical protein
MFDDINCFLKIKDNFFYINNLTFFIIFFIKFLVTLFLIIIYNIKNNSLIIKGINILIY